MNFTKAFFANISLLITLAYLFNLGYKHIFQYATNKVKYMLTVGVFILGGILTMIFGLRLNAENLVDLRLVPVIVAILLFPSPVGVAIIGFGIGLARLGMNWDAIGFSGFVNMTVIGLVGAVFNSWFRRKTGSFLWKSIIVIVVINVIFVCIVMVSLQLIQSKSFYSYWQNVGIYVFPLRIVLSCLFVIIIRDFQKEQQRVDELRTMNLLLRRQTRESRQAKREVEEKARELILASKYKSEFLANMSHELKTPLNSIILLSQLIRDNDEERYEGEELRYADLIHGAGNELLQLINDILDLSKVEAGKMDIYFEQVSTHELVQILHQQFLPLAQQKKIDFEIDMAPNVPLTFKTDALRFNQILRNLLVNAFKFTDEGSVKLVVRLEGPYPSILEPTIKPGKRWIRSLNPAVWKAPANKRMLPQRLSFMVVDTGIGIEPDKQKLIFEAFQQEDGAINRKYGGTGLGLSISQQLSRLLWGTLSLEGSNKGEGSKFTLRVPLSPPKSLKQ